MSCLTSSNLKTMPSAPIRSTLRVVNGVFEDIRVTWEILDAFRDAAVANGIPETDDFNRGDNEGCGYFKVNQKRGVRWNTSKAFLKPVRGRA